MLKTRFVALAFAFFVAASAFAEPPAARKFVAHLDGGQEVPAVATSATGQAAFELDASETALSYRLIVANIENVVAAHIHLGVAGTNGPVVAFLFGTAAPGGGPVNGVLAQGTITASDLTGPLAGMPLSVLVSTMRVQGTYANVHTNDGVAPADTGPGDFPAGEVRGQIMPLGPPGP